MQRKNVIGQRIREARKTAGFTQMKLAAELQLMEINIDRSAIAKIETDRRPITDIEIIAIARILKVPIEWLFEDSSKLFNG